MPQASNVPQEDRSASLGAAATAGAFGPVPVEAAGGDAEPTWPAFDAQVAVWAAAAPPADCSSAETATVVNASARAAHGPHFMVIGDH